MMSETLELSSSATLEIRASNAEALEVEATYEPGGWPPPVHFHPAQDERFEVLAGAVRVNVDGEERQLSVGDRIEIARGSSHQMWNAGEETAKLSWRTTPAGRTEQWFRALDALNRRGETEGEAPAPAEYIALVEEYRDVIRFDDAG